MQGVEGIIRLPEGRRISAPIPVKVEYGVGLLDLTTNLSAGDCRRVNINVVKVGPHIGDLLSRHRKRQGADRAAGRRRHAGKAKENGGVYTNGAVAVYVS